ncbi:MAG TPA: tetratricopeptide repeat protein [Syntrophales bacterium]|nr:tetratricopeptide repeat protein [Syntrophales bacterium]
MTSAARRTSSPFFRAIQVLALAAALWLPAACAAVRLGPEAVAPPEPDPGTSPSSGYHYSLAVLENLGGQTDGAIREMERAIERDPKSAFLKTELATLYMEKRDTQKAIALCEEALADEPDSIDVHLLLGNVYLTIKDYQNAAKVFRKAIEIEPNHATAHLFLGTIYAETKQYPSAVEVFQRLLRIDPDHVMGNFYYARLLTEMKRYPEAEAAFQKTLALKPSFEPVLTELAALYERQKKTAAAAQLYRDFIQSNPQRLNIKVKLAELLVRERQFQEAEQLLQDVLSAEPRYRDARVSLGVLYYEQGTFQKAADIFAALTRDFPSDARIRYLYASSLEENKQPEKALDEYRRIPHEFDLYVNAQIHAAMLLKKLGRLPEAISGLQAALLLKRDAADLYLFLSNLQEDGKNVTAAEETLQRGIAVLPKNIELHYALGVLFEKTNRFEESVRHMEIILKIDPDHAEALNFIGYSYADRGLKLTEAEQMIRKALSLKPGSGHIIDSLGWVYFRQNKIDQAIKHLKEALELLPNDPAVIEHLGDAYLKGGRTADALELFRRALRLAPENGALKKKIDDLVKKK